MATKTAMDADMVNRNQETLFSKVEFPYVVPVEDLKHILPYIKSLFCARKIPNVQLAGRLKYFIENWKILTNDTEILSLVEGYITPFHKIPQQKNIPDSPKLSQEEKILVQKEIHEMSNKRAIAENPNSLEGEFISNLFLVKKKRWGEPTSNKLETPKSVHTFKMEGLYCLQNILIGHTIEETLMVRDTVIFLLQQIGFVLNLKKSLLTPTQRIEFLGVTVDSLIMTLSLPEKKFSKVQKQFLKLVQKTQVWILELAKLIGLLP